MRLSSRVLAFIPGRVCDRYAELLYDLARAHYRRDGLAVPDDLGAALFELVDAGEQWRHARTLEDGSDGSACAAAHANVAWMTTRDVARLLDNCTVRNVADLAKRKRIPARRGRGGRLLFDPLDVDDYLRERSA